MNVMLITYIVGGSFGVFLSIQYILFLLFTSRTNEVKRANRDSIYIICIGFFLILSSILGIFGFYYHGDLSNLISNLRIISGICILIFFVFLMRFILITVKDMTFVETDGYRASSRNYLTAFQIISAILIAVTLLFGLFRLNKEVHYYILISAILIYLIVVIAVESREFFMMMGKEQGKITPISRSRYSVIFYSGIITIVFSMAELGLYAFSREDVLLKYGSFFMYGTYIFAVGLSLNLIFEYMEVLSKSFESNRKLTEMNRHMMEDVRTAQSLQISLLPLEKQKFIQGFLDMEISYMPMQSVGGDYYDFYKLDDENILVFLGDASGHGVYAAMIWAMLKVEVEELIEGKKFINLSEAFTLLNLKITRILENTYSYATLFSCLINLKTRVVSYISAGHTDQYYYQAADKSATCIRNKNPIIGTFKTAVFTADSIQTQAGDMIMLYSDGIVEGTNPLGEQLGRDRLTEIFLESAKMNAGASDTISSILMKLEDFFEGTLQKDDRTIMVIRL